MHSGTLDQNQFSYSTLVLFLFVQLALLLITSSQHGFVNNSHAIPLAGLVGGLSASVLGVVFNYVFNKALILGSERIDNA